MQKSVYILGAIILLVVAYKLFFNSKAKTGSPAPNINAELIDGSDFNWDNLKGNYVLVDFWGSWCPPCRKEIPALVGLYNQFQGQQFKSAKGFEILSIALEKNDKTSKAVAEKAGFTWKNQIIETAKFVAVSPLARAFGVTDLPSKFLIDPEGNLVGEVSLAEVKKVLQEELK